MANSTAGLMIDREPALPLGEHHSSGLLRRHWGQTNYAGNYGGPGMIRSCNGIIIPPRGDLFVSSSNLGPVSWPR